MNKKIDLGMSYKKAQQAVYGYYKQTNILEMMVASEIACRVREDGEDMDELIREKIGAWTLDVIGETGARAFEFAVKFFVLYPGGIDVAKKE